MHKKDIIVIGGSAGGFDAIKTLITGLPTDFNASIFIVWHMHPETAGILPEVLSRLQSIPATNAYNGETVEPRHIYVAPPDHHMMLEGDIIRLSRGPKENRFRPAVDPLFRSAAYIYRSRVIGVVLSGALDDGTSGLWSVKQYGGTAIVQDPKDALVPAMPASAMKAVNVDFVVPVTEIPGLLAELARTPAGAVAIEENNSIITREINIALQNNHGIELFGAPTRFTCPECHGSLSVINDGERIRYRCHTGHAFSADCLLEGISENIEESLWNAIRGVEEGIMLLNTIGDHFASHNQPHQAALYFKKASEAIERNALLRQAVLPAPLVEN
jgi:two-component system chemotaxis response regulator CheB